MIDRRLVRGGRWRACARAYTRRYGWKVRPVRKIAQGVWLVR
jgi:hypothetical protein